MWLAHRYRRDLNFAATHGARRAVCGCCAWLSSALLAGRVDAADRYREEGEREDGETQQ